MGNTNFKVYRSDEFININIEKVPENRALTCMVKYSLNLDALSRYLPRPSRLQFFYRLHYTNYTASNQRLEVEKAWE